MGLPDGNTKLLCFDQEGPDSELGAQYRRSALSEDGSTLYFRHANEGGRPWRTRLSCSLALGLRALALVGRRALTS